MHMSGGQPAKYKRRRFKRPPRALPDDLGLAEKKVVACDFYHEQPCGFAACLISIAHVELRAELDRLKRAGYWERDE